MSKLQISEGEIKLLMELSEFAIGYLLSKTTITTEDRDKLLEYQGRLNSLKTKEQKIADGDV